MIGVSAGQTGHKEKSSDDVEHDTGPPADHPRRQNASHQIAAERTDTEQEKVGEVGVHVRRGRGVEAGVEVARRRAKRDRPTRVVTVGRALRPPSQG